MEGNENGGDEELANDNDSITTIFSTSSRSSALTLMSMPVEELQKTLHLYDESKIHTQQNENDVLLKQGTSVQEEVSMDCDQSDGDSEASISQDELPVPATLQNRLNGTCPPMNYKEYYRRVRKRLSKDEYSAFADWIRQLNELRERRQRRKIVPKMHPFMFGCWPTIPIKVGKWATPDFIGRIDVPPSREEDGPVVKIRVPKTTKRSLPLGTDCCPKHCFPPPISVKSYLEPSDKDDEDDGDDEEEDRYQDQDHDLDQDQDDQE